MGYRKTWRDISKVDLIVNETHQEQKIIIIMNKLYKKKRRKVQTQTHIRERKEIAWR